MIRNALATSRTFQKRRNYQKYLTSRKWAADRGSRQDLRIFYKNRKTNRKKIKFFQVIWWFFLDFPWFFGFVGATHAQFARKLVNTIPYFCSGFARARSQLSKTSKILKIGQRVAEIFEIEKIFKKSIFSKFPEKSSKSWKFSTFFKYDEFSKTGKSNFLIFEKSWKFSWFWWFF